MFPRKEMLYLLIIIILAACRPAVANELPAELENRAINAVATTGMIADVVREIGGERVNIEGMMGPGVDPHLYKASASDVRLLEQADVIFYNGLHLEAGMGNVLERMSSYKLTVPIAEAIPVVDRLADPIYPDAHDPHVWFDVSLWMKAVERVRETLIELDPNNAAIYERNAIRYLQELADLHEYVRGQAEQLPADQRVLITAHDAFGYFGRAYGFEVVGLQGISTETEASTADVSALAGLIVSKRIPAIFIESSVPTRNIEAVEAAVRNQGFEVQIGGELFSDALGDPDTPEGNYIGMVRHNINTIVHALLESRDEVKTP
jgi:manganese/zinc/iron transport system substrate-binding protein